MNIFSTNFNYQKRMNALRNLMQERGIDAILVNIWTNQYYLSGMYQHAPWYPIEVCYNTETPLIIFQDMNKEPIFLITYLTGIGLKEGTWIKDVRIIDKEPYAQKSWNEYVAEVLTENGLARGTIGIEEDVCVLSTYKKIQSALPMAQFKSVDDIFQIMRLIKDPEEISLVNESVSIAEAGLKAGIDAAKVGVLESEVQKAAEIEMKRRGAIREVETMCQSGIRTANHRAFGANWKKIEENELVTIDIGCVYKGYGSDLTRTWCVGKPTEFYQKVADDMSNVREKVFSQIKPGVLVGYIRDFGREEMKKLGYRTDKKLMPSNELGLGGVGVHGIGLGPMHDPPQSDKRDIVLQSGVTLAVSCCARFADFTIRFEDNIVIVPDGVKLLNSDLPWKL